LRTAEDGRVVAHDTGEREVVDTGLVLRAVGYRGMPLPGLPFDQQRGIIPNEQGKVADTEREYVVGWIKRGPTGIIGTNRKDAMETVQRLLTDLGNGTLTRHTVNNHETVEEWLTKHQPDLVTEQGWQRIDAAEQAAGKQAGRPRIKLCTTDELLQVALTEDAASHRIEP
jgi:ferredoxin--NADP+ reductase